MFGDGNVEESQRVPPFSFFRHCETSRKNFNDFKGSSLQFCWCFATEMLKNPKGSPFERANSVQLFGFSGTVKKRLDTLKSFCYFWALDTAPTYAVPGLLKITQEYFATLLSLAFETKLKHALHSSRDCFPSFEEIETIFTQCAAFVSTGWHLQQHATLLKLYWQVRSWNSCYLTCPP